MSKRMTNLNIIIKHTYTEPKFKAWAEWGNGHPSLAAQLMEQVGRDALEELPDWDWWEPRYDQPWRRKQARHRELDALLGVVSRPWEDERD